MRRVWDSKKYEYQIKLPFFNKKQSYMQGKQEDINSQERHRMKQCYQWGKKRKESSYHFTNPDNSHSNSSSLTPRRL